MGQQQLLLIVLGVIIVGIAIVVGINLFNANAEESAKDTLVSEGTNLGAMAQQFYKKPVALGGGGNSFTTSNGAPNDWTIPTNLINTAGGSWAETVGADEVVLTGTPDASYNYAWTVEVTVTPTSITSEIL
ncbi:MAG: hypothetical protein KGZ85_10530 [Ignavibacterium sp.]|nr:hypothetical protein [Ignavibacterium sp.]MBS4034892.1 hypothetical protein [Ignavibacterium sp.]